MQPFAKRRYAVMVVQDNAANELLASCLLQALEAIEVGRAHRCRCLDFDPDNASPPVLDDKIDFLLFARAKVRKAKRAAARRLIAKVPADCSSFIRRLKVKSPQIVTEISADRYCSRRRLELSAPKIRNQTRKSAKVAAIFFSNRKRPQPAFRQNCIKRHVMRLIRHGLHVLAVKGHADQPRL